MSLGYDPTPATPLGSPARLQQETVFWESIRENTTVADRLAAPRLADAAIEAGTFRMGCVSGGGDTHDDKLPVHEVEVASFALTKHGAPVR